MPSGHLTPFLFLVKDKVASGTGGTNRVVPLSLWRSHCMTGGLAEGDNDETFKKAWKRCCERLYCLQTFRNTYYHKHLDRTSSRNSASP